MKKLITLLITIISFALMFSMNGCAAEDNFTAQKYSSVDSKIQSVSIDVQSRQITVSTSQDNQLRINYFESKKEYYDISVSKDNVLVVTLIKNKEWTDYFGTKPPLDYRKINIEIPHALLSNLTITTTDENIILSPIAVEGAISLSSNGGSIEFEQMSVGTALTLATKNGGIMGTIIGSYDTFSIACEIKKGECNLPLAKTDGEKSLIANCNNGDIVIDFVKAPLLSI